MREGDAATTLASTSPKLQDQKARIAIIKSHQQQHQMAAAAAAFAPSCQMIQISVLCVCACMDGGPHTLGYVPGE